MNADGTGAHEFISKPGPGWDGIAEPSPDGRWVAYWDVPEDGSGAPSGAYSGISVVRADGTGPVVETGPVLTGTASYLWSPDSTRILMIPSDGSSGSAFLLGPTGGQWATVPWISDTDLDWQRLAP